MTIRIENFAKLALEEFDRFLARRGFVRLSQKVEGQSFTADYLSGIRYISIKASTDPRDSPPHFNVIMGEGSLEWPECDWNSVALWRLRNFLEQAERGGEYDLSSASNARKSLKQALDDLVSFDGGFLEGNMTAFRKARSLQNQGREPYRIHEPDPAGGYKTRFDPVSEELKERFS